MTAANILQHDSAPRAANSLAAQPDLVLQVANLEAGYGAVRILHSVSFQIPPGETLVVLGESGCGKTTLLKAIAGLIPISGGEIRLDSQNISPLCPQERRVIYLDQEPLLFEHLSVSENVGFALRLQNTPAAVLTAAVDEILTAISLAGYERRKEWQLSGGQKQRVAFARAILAQPRLLLLDEPFCSLDGDGRGQMQALFAALCRRYALTSIFVTHDVKEALIVGDRFARMSRGALSLYPDRQAFIRDEATGVSGEIDFWKNIARERS